MENIFIMCRIMQKGNIYHFSRINMARTSPSDLETTEADVDKWDIRKLYASVTGDNAQEWHFNMQNPTSDNRLRNLERANLRRREDESWFVDGTGGNNGSGQVRLEAWCESGNKKWLNTEVTVY